MIKKFLNERRSWIFLIISLQLLLLFISYIDSSLNVTSALYVIFLSILILTVFLIVRYHQEAPFYKTLENWHPSNDLSSLKTAETPFESLVEEKIKEQKRYYQNELSVTKTNVEQEKDELLRWIHEVKTPLTALQLMIDRVEDSELKAQLLFEWLRIDLLLDQQLHQKRLPFMKNDLYIEKVKLEPIIYQEIKGLRSWCMQKGIGFTVHLNSVEVFSDAKWLHFIFRQLLTNAVKYSESTDIIIHSINMDDSTLVTIQDFGRGIPAKDLPRIFDKGFTSTMHHKDNAATGMGLYLTKQAAGTLKIHMDVTSTVGEGTTFTLTFPKENDFLAITSM